MPDCDTDFEEASRARDHGIREAIARGEVESVWSYAVRRPGATMGSALSAIWPSAVVGAGVGAGLALGIYLLLKANAQFLISVGFVVGWLRSLYEYVHSSWFVELRMREEAAESKRLACSGDELYRMIANLLTVFRTTGSVKTPTGFRQSLDNLQAYVNVSCAVDSRRLDRAQRNYVQTVRERCLADSDRLSGMVDRLLTALDPPDLQAAEQLYGEIDTVFRPIDGGNGWDVLVRGARE